MKSHGHNKNREGELQQRCFVRIKEELWDLFRGEEDQEYILECLQIFDMFGAKDCLSLSQVLSGDNIRDRFGTPALNLVVKGSPVAIILVEFRPQA